MASGKSLELKKFDEEHSEEKRQDKICVGCGMVWSKHLKKDGKRMKKYEGLEHRVNGTYVKPR